MGQGPGPGARRPRVPEALGCEPGEHIPVRQASKDSLEEKDASTAMSFLVSLLPPLPCLNVRVVFMFFFLSRVGVWQHVSIQPPVQNRSRYMHIMYVSTCRGFGEIFECKVYEYVRHTCLYIHIHTHI